MHVFLRRTNESLPKCRRDTAPGDDRTRAEDVIKPRDEMGECDGAKSQAGLCKEWGGKVVERDVGRDLLRLALHTGLQVKC